MMYKRSILNNTSGGADTLHELTCQHNDTATGDMSVDTQSYLEECSEWTTPLNPFKYEHDNGLTPACFDYSSSQESGKKTSIVTCISKEYKSNSVTPSV